MTAIYGIIGDPIKHSLSAKMQNRAFAKAKIDAIYLPFHVQPEGLVTFIESARNWQMSGFNVTIPHKVSIMEFLDEIEEEAKAIGAVNTISFKNNQLLGDNTDAQGYLRSLKQEAHWSSKGKVVTLLGAGGAARAVVYGLLNDGVKKLFIINRTHEKACQIAEFFKHSFSEKIIVIKWEEESMREALEQSDLLINATSIGLKGSSFDNLPLEVLSKKAIVSDLVYRPRKTPLLKQAKELGLKTHEGIGMLLYQGVESFKIWTGIEPDINVMREALEEN